jgi:hypothetical protein
MQAHTLQPLGEVGIVSVEISMRLPDEFAISIEGAGEPGKWVHTTLTRVCFSAPRPTVSTEASQVPYPKRVISSRANPFMSSSRW